jgi:nickel-dependent lactate racemase
MADFRFGSHGSIRLDVPENILVGEFVHPRGVPIDDVQGAALEALREPIGFPPLSQAAVPGDKVAIAVDPDVPRAGQVVTAIVAELGSSGVSAEDISVLIVGRSKPDEGELIEDLDAGVRGRVQLIVHDPSDREKLSYLAATDEAKPIYLNRLICDADLVLTVGCQRVPESLGYHGVSSTLFPTFSDAKTVQRYRSPAIVESPVQQRRLQRQADQARWLLGSAFTVQVVPGADNSVLHVVAGEVEAVRGQAGKLCAEAWRYEVPQRADLVVASVTGQSSDQTWDNVARALAAAMRVVAPDGVIALCTDLEEGPGPALQHLAGAENRERAVREIIKEQPADALPAMQLMHALEHGPVYLLSRLDDALVEELGMAAISEPQQLARLTRRTTSCILLSDAQFAVPTAVGDRISEMERA